MKQIFEDVGSGKINVTDIPLPACKSDSVLIQTSVSLISAGTERMLVDFGRAGYLKKARQQPEKVRMVLDKARTDGLLATIDAVKAKLGEPVALGYSNVGRVIEVGKGVTDLTVGDRVLSNGQHAEFVCVGKNLCARIPDEVSDEQAVFGIVGSIALQGVRLAEPTLGECFVVTGLGLVGLMTVQLLRASGCRVIGADLDEAKLELARSLGAAGVNASDSDALLRIAREYSRGRGVDGVIITAATDSNEPVHQAAQMCRKRGRIVLVGVVGPEIRRSDFYEKELTFQVSCSYGPGRYDPAYEDQGIDYPSGFVRWTEQRNFEAILDMMASGAVSTERLLTSRFGIDHADRAYDKLIDDRSALGILIDYPSDPAPSRSRSLSLATGSAAGRRGKASIAAIGAGNYAGRVLLPAFAKTGARLTTVVSTGGRSAASIGRKLGFESASTDIASTYGHHIDTHVIATRHDTHAQFTMDALAAGKNVFVEKPLALRDDELDDIDAAYRAAYERGDNPLLMIGFNRRFAATMQLMKSAVDASSQPMTVLYTCNAGAVPRDSWVQDPDKGGGRIVGEACHFIDATRFLAGSPIVEVQVGAMSDSVPELDCRDSVSITMRFANGSLGVILYLANGHRGFPKERIEVFQSGHIYTIDNFRRLTSHGGGPSLSQWKQDKGQEACCAAFVTAIQNGEEAPIPYDEIMEVSRASIEAARLASNR